MKDIKIVQYIRLLDYAYNTVMYIIALVSDYTSMISLQYTVIAEVGGNAVLFLYRYRYRQYPTFFKCIVFGTVDTFFSPLTSLVVLATRDGNSAAYAAARCCWCTAPRSVATKICITSQHQRSAAYKNFFTFFFTIIAGDFLFINNNG